MSSVFYKIPVVGLIVIVCLTVCLGSSAKVHINLNNGHIETFSDVSEPASASGQGPGAVKIDMVDTDSCVYHIFESCGCSEYYIAQTYKQLQLDVYSMLSVIWGADCSREDRPPFDVADADMKFSFTYDESGLKGRISIIDNFDRYAVSRQPAMGYVASHPDECTKESGEPFYRKMLYLIKYYRHIGHSNDELYDFIVAFEREVERQNLMTNRDFEFRQIEYMQVCALYKFALKNEGKELGIAELKELGAITSGIISYYTKPVVIPSTRP
ncbi:MAG: hypothetical protein K2N28_00750 [Muribaculaceae bacterium]|nr:hypothetical protein [Muribaculaceae bacterium]